MRGDPHCQKTLLGQATPVALVGEIGRCAPTLTLSWASFFSDHPAAAPTLSFQSLIYKHQIFYSSLLKLLQDSFEWWDQNHTQCSHPGLAKGEAI